MYFLQHIQQQFHSTLRISFNEAPNSEIYSETGERRTEKTSEIPDAMEIHTRAEKLTGNIDTTLDTSAQRQEQLQTGEAGRTAEGLGLDTSSITAAEALDTGETVSPEAIGNIETQQRALEQQISNLPVGSPERVALEKRQSFFGAFLSAVQNSGGSAAGGKVIDIAKNEVGTQESTGDANKYLLGMAQDAKNTPWCAGFVNWTLEKAGVKGTDSLLAKSFIGGEGKGHVGFKIGNECLGGNQNNEVSQKAVSDARLVAGYVMPEDVGNTGKVQKGPIKFSEIPDGAIVVFERGGGES